MGSIKSVRKDDFGEKFLQDYLEVFENHSINNENYGRFALHVVLGQSLKNISYSVGSRKIDIRVHMFLIKPQGTGKGAGYGICIEMAKRLGLNFAPLTESTDGGLAGSKKYDPSKKEDVVVDGVLKEADIVGMEEASVLIDMSSEFSKKNMTYMQITMNPLEDKSCHIQRNLVGTKIDLDPHASFLLMSYPPDKITDKIIKTGFMDRMVVIFEDVTLAQRLETIRKIIEKSSQTEDEKRINKKKKEFVMQRLEIIVKKFQKKELTYDVPKEIHESILQCIDEMSMMILDASPKAREKLEHFTSRLYDILVKLAIHRAIIGLRTKIRISDVLYARMIYLPIWKNLIVSVESLLIVSPEERYRRSHIKSCSIKIYNVMKKKGYHMRGNYARRRTIVKKLQPMLDNCSRETADRALLKLEQTPDMYGKFTKVSKYEKGKIFKRRYIGDVAYLKLLK